MSDEIQDVGIEGINPSEMQNQEFTIGSREFRIQKLSAMRGYDVVSKAYPSVSGSLQRRDYRFSGRLYGDLREYAVRASLANHGCDFPSVLHHVQERRGAMGQDGDRS